METGRVLHQAMASYIAGVKKGEIFSRDIMAARVMAGQAYTDSTLPSEALEDLEGQLHEFADNHWFKGETIQAVELSVKAIVAEGLEFYAIFDLVTRDERGHVIITDWKTQRRFPVEGDARAKAQLERYAAAWVLAYGAAEADFPITLRVEYTRWGKKDELQVQPEDLERLECRLRADCSRVLREKALPPRPSPECARCVYQQNCLEEGTILLPGLPLESAEQARDLLNNYILLSAQVDSYKDVLTAWGKENGPIELEQAIFDRIIVKGSERLDKDALRAMVENSGESWSRYSKKSPAHERWSVGRKGAKNDREKS